MDSEGLRDGELLPGHSLFQAAVSGRSIDLSREPWRQLESRWTHKTDYSGCQDLADRARGKAVQWIAYLSVRNPGGRCAAVLDAAITDLEILNRGAHAGGHGYPTANALSVDHGVRRRTHR